LPFFLHDPFIRVSLLRLSDHHGKLSEDGHSFAVYLTIQEEKGRSLPQSWIRVQWLVYEIYPYHERTATVFIGNGVVGLDVITELRW